MKNKLYTKSYFKKRIIESGLEAFIVDCEYTLNKDIRYWTMIINPKRHCIWITCYKNEANDYWFRIDAPQKSNIFLRTLSMDVVINTIKDLIEGVELVDA